MFLSNLRVKSLIATKIENNIFERMTYRFVSKQLKHNLNLETFFVYFENRIQYQITIKYKIDM